MTTSRPSGAAQKLRQLLESAVEKTDARAVLLSGGLGSSVVAFLAARRRGMAAVTVSVSGRSPDEPFAKRVAREGRFTHVWVRPDVDDVVGLLPQTVRVLRSYDPVLVRGAVAVHTGFLMVKELNLPSALTGDGADALFAPAGHSGSCRAAEVGAALGVGVQTPFLDPALKEFAEELPPESSTRLHEGVRFDRGILREAFDGDMPEDVVWRETCPVEKGAGSSVLSESLARRVSDEEFRREAEDFRAGDGVRLRDKEHLYYYKLYRAQFGPPAKSDALESRREPAGEPVTKSGGAA